jgi:large subunit ribosomal protein L2
MTAVKSLKQFKPTSAGVRFKKTLSRSGLSKKNAHKSLLGGLLSKKGGRNNTGRITVRHQGGGHKRKYRLIDFLRCKDDVPAKVEQIEYDPNRSANIALLLYADGERSYIIAPKDLHVGDTVQSGSAAPIKVGNSLPLKKIPIGANIHCIELKKDKGAQLARSAGASVQLLAKEAGYALLKLKSGETRKVILDCRATIGEVGNSDHNLRSLGKAGAKRWQGKRPTVRGVAMNPVDHPHGGGEGKTSGGRHPVTPWGQPTKGYKTRNKKRTDVFILSSRHREK